MANIETLFPPDPEMTEQAIDRALDRPQCLARLAVSGAAAATVSVAALQLWRHFHAYTGLDQE